MTAPAPPATLSLARLGARMTGLDFSPAALEQARALAERAGPAVEYAQAELHDAVDALGAERFDLVFTGIGAVGAFVFGIVMMGEALTVARVASAALIVAGLIGLKLSSAA